MNINIKEYILNEIGDTRWHGETHSDNDSYENMAKIDEYLTIIEDIRGKLLSKLEEHKNYRKGNYSAEMLHEKAKKIFDKHIINEFANEDFDEYFNN